MTSIETGLVLLVHHLQRPGHPDVVLDASTLPPASRAVASGRTGTADALVDIELVAPVAAGDVVLVHAGVALALLGTGALA